MVQSASDAGCVGECGKAPARQGMGNRSDGGGCFFPGAGGRAQRRHGAKRRHRDSSVIVRHVGHPIRDARCPKEKAIDVEGDAAVEEELSLGSRRAREDSLMQRP